MRKGAWIHLSKATKKDLEEILEDLKEEILLLIVINVVKNVKFYLDQLQTNEFIAVSVFIKKKEEKKSLVKNQVQLLIEILILSMKSLTRS